MQTFYLEVLSPDRIFYRGECVSLTVPVTDGMIGVMAHRAPIMAALVPGEASFTLPDGTKTVFSVSVGMLDVLDNNVKVLSENILLPDEINEDEELEEERIARMEMQRKQSLKEARMSELMLTQAVNNLRIKKKTINN